MKSARVILPVAALVIGLAVLFWPLIVSERSGPANLRAFAALPVMHEGRVKPLDSVARDSLLVISGRRSVVVDGQTRPAIRWLLDVITDQQPPGGYRVFRIDHPQLLALLGLPSERQRFAYEEFAGRVDQLEMQARLADQVPAADRDVFQRSVLLLAERLMVYESLRHLESVLPLPPKRSGDMLFLV